MDWAPHTDADVERLLGHLGLDSLDGLFDHLPAAVRLGRDLDVPPPLSEQEVMTAVDELGSANQSGLVCFAGGGVYDHLVPAVVRALTMRPEFVTSYTPYQPEISQGVLQALFEYQSMICALTGMDVANASLYDGATAAVEAVNLAVGATGRNTVWVSAGVHPHTRETIRSFVAARDIEVVEHPLDGGRTVWDADRTETPAAVMVSQPNYLGVVEDYETPARLAAEREALAVAAVDPMTLGLLRPPGEAGYDIAVGEGQSLGNPMSFGGPVVGLFATRRRHVRRLPGRLVGATVDTEGATAYTMTLRTREQDIRREKATSNICTNQTLNAVAAAIQLTWLGPGGLVEFGRQSYHKAHYLAERLEELAGVEVATPAPFVREFPLRLPADPHEVVLDMAARGYLAGIPLTADYAELGPALLVAVTERRTRAELDGYVAALKEVLAGG